MVKVRPATEDEVAMLAEGAALISLLYPAQNEAIVQAVKARGASVIALDKIPRITRAQKMDVLSSMANLSGYRAVLEAAAAMQGFFGAQVTAAGTTPPKRVLIIGAGVAGLAAIGTARSLGAEVRAFDTRAAAREQVESLGAAFLEVEFEESGEGGGGYARVMSPEFIAAEMELFRQQAKEVDVVVTTALIPGRKAPILLPRDVTEHLEPGSIVVDMAAEQGGNCELTVPGEAHVHNGITILGYTDLPSRMANTASRFFSGNITHLLSDMVGEQGFRFDLDDEVVRGATIVLRGEILEPPPPPAPPAPKKHVDAPARELHSPQKNIMKPNRGSWINTVFGLLGLGLLFAIGRYAPSEFLQHFTVFILACFVGWQVVWSVTPALHTPLMSVTNAISGIIVVGGLLQAGDGELDLAGLLGAAAILVATINIFGGFYVTQRMLRMFRKDAS